MNEPASPKMFPSQALPDEPQLCFNKTHFTRSDFNVERFMNLARRRAALKEIHNDLRIYLKSIQNSMIELINDDYADFVHLSSNLVSLKEAIDKIDTDIANIWSDFQTSTKESVDVAEQIEIRCEELSRNRLTQLQLRNKIIFITALERMAKSLNNLPSPVNMLWLEQLTSSVVDATAFRGELEAGSKEENAFNKVMGRCQAVLGEQAVISLKKDCLLLPLILSVLGLSECTDQLVAKIVSAVLVPKVVTSKKVDAHTSLINALDAVKKIRSEWSSRLGPAWTGHVEYFLDQTLLTFLVAFLDEHLATVLCPTVPSDTKQFHKCFQSVSNFISEWSTASRQKTLLKQLRGKFQLSMYFKMVTNSFSKHVTEMIDPLKFALRNEEEKNKDGDDEEPVDCTTSVAVLEAIRNVWSENVFLYPLADKLWDFTLRMLEKHRAWAKAMLEHVENSKDEDQTIPKWIILLKVRSDSSKVDQKVFDIALEVIWMRLREMNIDSSPFGQCLTKYSQLVKTDCEKIDELIKKIVGEQIKKDFDSVADVPRQYRWTKKPSPSTFSTYITTAHVTRDSFKKESDDCRHSITNECPRLIMLDAYEHFANKADQVLQTVEATGSSLYRFKKREGSVPDGETDEQKIRSQIGKDVEECIRQATEMELEIPVLNSLMQRVRDAEATEKRDKESNA